MASTTENYENGLVAFLKVSQDFQHMIVAMCGMTAMVIPPVASVFCWLCNIEWLWCFVGGTLGVTVLWGRAAMVVDLYHMYVWEPEWKIRPATIVCVALFGTIALVVKDHPRKSCWIGIGILAGLLVFGIVWACSAGQFDPNLHAVALSAAFFGILSLRFYFALSLRR